MKKKDALLVINNEKIPFENNSPLSIEVCKIVHSPVHYHSETFEIVFCLKGIIYVICNHEKVKLSQNEMFTINYNDLHCIYSDTDNRVIIMHFSLYYFDTFGSRLYSSYFACEDSSCQAFQKEALNNIKSNILTAAYMNLKGTLTIPSSISIAKNIICTLINEFDWFNMIDLYQNKNPEIHKRLMKTIDYCIENYTEKLTISNLAKSVNISENYFSHFFKRSPYGGFGLMIGYIRCFHAQYMILTTHMSVIEISNACGFSSDKYFYKSFRYWWKQTPKEYKKWFTDYIKSPDEIHSPSDEDVVGILESYIASFFTDSLIENLNKKF